MKNTDTTSPELPEPNGKFTTIPNAFFDIMPRNFTVSELMIFLYVTRQIHDRRAHSNSKKDGKKRS